MKKNLLSLFVLLLSATLVSAQANFVTKIAGDELLTRPSATLKTLQKAPIISQPKRITLADGERLMGYYTGEEYSSGDAIGLRSAGDYRAGTMFSAEMIKKLAGGQITKVRFALAKSVGASTVRVYQYSNNQVAEVSTTAVASTVAGYNEVTLETPVTIEEGYGILIGYDFTQVSGEYPLLTDYSVNTDREYQCGMLFYGNFGTSGTTWYNMGTSAGEFLIQAVVNGGSFADDDIALRSLSTANPFCKAGETLNFSFKIKNDGNNAPGSYKLNVKLDG